MKFRLISILFLLITNVLFSQDIKQDVKENKVGNDSLKQWYFQDPTFDKYAGISLTKAYSHLPVGISPTTIIVAVIDAGADSVQPDLKENIWTNTKEIPGNGIDDDHNGYIDDVHGWSFIGGKTGDVEHDNIEITRLYKLKKSGIPQEYSWKKIRKAYHKEYKEAKKEAKLISKLNIMMDDIAKQSGKTPVPVEDVDAYHAHGVIPQLAKKQFVLIMKAGETFESLKKEINDGDAQTQNVLNYDLNTDYDMRKVVGDDYSNVKERFYGNNNFMGPECSHGTHVSGIIGAIRNNSIGMDGIATNVKLMILRIVPDGDERDKDVASAIRYATDNGARIINMSFGKAYSPAKAEVDEAVKYAVSKGVLLVHAAGNESTNNDANPNYPSAIYKSDSTKAVTWIEVGASDYKGNAASFSNYGKETVDLFAPGVQIYSTLPNNNFGYESGTSMSAPVVSGVAALVWSYFPTLTAEELKEVLMTSATRKDSMTSMPGNRKLKVHFSELSVSGGIINAEKALEIAGKMARH